MLHAGPNRLDIPQWSTLNSAALLLAAGAMIARQRLCPGMVWTRGLCAGVGVLLHLIHV